MSSAYSSYATVSPASLHDHNKDEHELGPHYNDTSYIQNNHIAAPIVDPQQLLSPYSSHIRSNSASPSNTSLTPADSTTSLYVVPSEFGESEWSDDPFFGADFSDINRGTPSFLSEAESQTSWPAPPTSDPAHGQPDPPSPQEPDSIASNTSVPHLTPDTNAGQYIIIFPINVKNDPPRPSLGWPQCNY